MKNLKPNGQRAKNAITLIRIVLAIEIASLISGYFQYNLLQSVEYSGPYWATILADTGPPFWCIPGHAIK